MEIATVVCHAADADWAREQGFILDSDHVSEWIYEYFNEKWWKRLHMESGPHYAEEWLTEMDLWVTTDARQWFDTERVSNGQAPTTLYAGTLRWLADNVPDHEALTTAREGFTDDEHQP